MNLIAEEAASSIGRKVIQVGFLIEGGRARRTSVTKERTQLSLMSSAATNLTVGVGCRAENCVSDSYKYLRIITDLRSVCQSVGKPAIQYSDESYEHLHHQLVFPTLPDPSVEERRFYDPSKEKLVRVDLRLDVQTLKDEEKERFAKEGEEMSLARMEEGGESSSAASVL